MSQTTNKIMKIQLSVELDGQLNYRNIEIKESIIGDNKAIQELLGNQALDILETIMEADNGTLGEDLLKERKETKGY